jgi:flagellar hook-associated protein 2
MRIGGLSSGMDIDKIVKDLMQAERIPLDKLFQRKVLAEWKRDEYRAVNTKLLGLRDTAFNMRLQSSFMIRTATSSNSAVVTATTTGNSQVGTFEIKVDKLAETAKVTTLDDKLLSVDQNNKIDPTQTLTSQKDKFRDSSGFTDGSGNPIQSEFVLNGETFFVDPDKDSLNDVLAKINNHPDAGINAFYDSHTDKVVFTTKATGASAQIIISGGDPDDPLPISFLTNTLGLAEGTEQGGNAQLTINGLATQRESNTFNLNGTNFTIHSVQAPGDSPIRIDIKQDVEKAFDNIMAFVNKYNEIIDSINGKYREPRSRDFLPLTDQQKEVMSDKEIERWEEQAKSGMLQGDSLLNRVLSNMRLALMSTVEGLEGGINSLVQIGITTGAWNENGKLHVNETKLKEALRDDPDQVMALFTNNPADNDPDKDKKLGLARRLYDAANGGIDRIAARGGWVASVYDQSFLSNEIRRYEGRMNAMDDRLKRVEYRYWRQFTAMEKGLSKMNSQADWLYQQLASFQT